MAYTLLTVRKIADTENGERLTKYDPDTGEKYLLNPANGKREGWPCCGIEIVGDPPQYTRVASSWVERMLADNLITATNYRTVMCPGGPVEMPWRSDKVHNFPQANTIVLHCEKHGELVYKVVKQPGKYYTSDKALVTQENISRYGLEPTAVHWFFDLQLENKPEK